MTDDTLWALSMTEDGELETLSKEELIQLVLYLRKVNLEIYEKLISL